MDNLYSDSDFITLDDFLKRLRKDLNDPDFFAYDITSPQSEEEYQQLLSLFKEVMDEQKKKSSK